MDLHQWGAVAGIAAAVGGLWIKLARLARDHGGREAVQEERLDRHRREIDELKAASDTRWRTVDGHLRQLLASVSRIEGWIDRDKERRE